MNFSQSLQYLKDRIIAVEKDLKLTSDSLKRDMKLNFRILTGLFALETVLVMGAFGLPLKEIIPGVIKLVVG